MYCMAEFRGELPSLFVEKSLQNRNEIETRYWKTKHLAPHMYCTTEFRGELPSLFVEQFLELRLYYNESFCVLYGVAKLNYEYRSSLPEEFRS